MDRGGVMARILVTHAGDARAKYYGDEALARLRELGEVRLNESRAPLSSEQLIEQARACEIIVSDRMTEGPAAVFERLPDLVAFVRCATSATSMSAPPLRPAFWSPGRARGSS